MNKTIENLAKAFIGESQARNRYTIYASAARKEGYEQIASIFQLTADQEREHANWLFKLINSLKADNPGVVEGLTVEAEMPTALSSTKDHLTAAIAGENFEYTKMYPKFAEQAEADGYKEIADRLRAIAKAEAHHEERYQKLLDVVENDSVFKKDQEVSWICRECGYEHVGTEPPTECPSCGHPRSFYELKSENY